MYVTTVYQQKLYDLYLLLNTIGQLHSPGTFSLIDRRRDKININVERDKNISATLNSKSRTVVYFLNIPGMIAPAGDGI